MRASCFGRVAEHFPYGAKKYQAGEQNTIYCPRPQQQTDVKPPRGMRVKQSGFEVCKLAIDFGEIFEDANGRIR